MPRDTVTNTIERIRRQLSSSIRLETNQLSVAMTTGSVVTFAYDMQNSIRSGSILSIGTELMRVTTINVAGREANVIRGWQDTDPEDHVVGAEVLVNPRFTYFDIFDAMVQEIDSWTPNLFTIEYFLATVESEDQVVKIPTAQAGAIGVISVRSSWTDSNSQSWPERNFVLQRGPVGWPAALDSGLLVRITDNGGYVRAGSLNIQLAMPYTSEITGTSTLSDIGIIGGLLELLELGVKYRMLADAEVGHSQRNAQGEPRRAEEVQPREAVSLSQVYMDRHDRKLSHEVRNLRARYPMSQW